MNKTDWQRRSALFDEAVDLPVAAREAWLRSLAAREPRHVDAVTKMLAEYVRDTGSTELPHKTLSLLGVAAREFEARLEAATDDELRLQAGDEIGAWRLKEKIGEGGMGAVWLAERHDGNFEGHAAIKFLRTGLGKTAVVERFLRERYGKDLPPIATDESERFFAELLTEVETWLVQEARQRGLERNRQKPHTTHIFQ